MGLFILLVCRVAQTSSLWSSSLRAQFGGHYFVVGCAF
jgi:hypothetical protein